MSLVETAAACGVSLATVKRRIARAEARLEERSHDT
jgi:DNA-directed RNA polymerase specialized sigma24 family protein